MTDDRSVGIIDSGVGGLTVIKEFNNLLPKENIIYLGDNKNVPYGNKTEEEIYNLAKKMIDFLVEKDVKIIAIACNTISSILDKYFQNYTLPIVSIIKPVSEYIYTKNLKSVGVLATKFTIESKIYEKLLHRRDEKLNIITESCPNLAGIIDRGRYADEEIEEIIDRHMHNIIRKNGIKDIILGCTHYPIVLEKFTKGYSDINFINPAYEQALYIEKLLKDLKIENKSKLSKFDIFTTGESEIYLNIIESLSIKEPDNIYEIKEF